MSDKMVYYSIYMDDGKSHKQFPCNTKHSCVCVLACHS